MRFGQRVDIDRGHEGDIRARRHRKAHANRSSGREEDVEMPPVAYRVVPIDDALTGVTVTTCS